MTFRIGVDSSTAIDIYPEFDFVNEKKQIASEHRNKNGSYKKYIWGHQTAFSFTLNYVPASDTALINEWFDDNTIISLFDDTQYDNLIIVNKSTPLAQHAEPYDTLYKGEILLEGGF